MYNAIVIIIISVNFKTIKTRVGYFMKLCVFDWPYMSNTYRFGFYLAVNLCVHYKDEPVNAVWRNVCEVPT